MNDRGALSKWLAGDVPRALVAVLLFLVITACSTSTDVDRARLDTLRADPMADYQPPTGESISFTEEVGRRQWALDHGWEENWSVVRSMWWLTATEEEVATDLAQALVAAGWKGAGSPEELAFPVSLAKEQNGYCSAISAVYTEPGGRGRLSLELAAPYSGSESNGCRG